VTEVRNADQLRARIDSGETGEKMPWSDPAAAPLGTDDEAGGSPPTPVQVASAYRQETAGGVVSSPPSGRGLGAAWWIIGFTAVVALTLIAIPFFL
jgi:hypothetical protein